MSLAFERNKLNNLINIPILFELQENSTILGDLNQDTILNILDVVQLVNIILELTVPSNYQLESGNLNQDDFINIQDIIILLNLILGNN